MHGLLCGIELSLSDLLSNEEKVYKLFQKYSFGRLVISFNNLILLKQSIDVINNLCYKYFHLGIKIYLHYNKNVCPIIKKFFNTYDSKLKVYGYICNTYIGHFFSKDVIYKNPIGFCQISYAEETDLITDSHKVIYQFKVTKQVTIISLLAFAKKIQYVELAGVNLLITPEIMGNFNEFYLLMFIYGNNLINALECFTYANYGIIDGIEPLFDFIIKNELIIKKLTKNEIFDFINEKCPNIKYRNKR